MLLSVVRIGLVGRTVITRTGLIQRNVSRLQTAGEASFMLTLPTEYYLS